MNNTNLTQEQIREIERIFGEKIRDFMDTPEFQDKITEEVQRYVEEKYGDEVSIREYFRENIFNEK